MNIGLTNRQYLWRIKKKFYVWRSTMCHYCEVCFVV